MSNSRVRWAQVAPAETPGLRGLTTLAVSVVVVAGLYLGREVLIPITLAILLSFVLAPLVDLFRRIHLGRVPSVVLAVFIAVSIILAIGGVIGIQIAGLADDVPKYETTIREKIDAAKRFAMEPLGRLIGSVGREVDRAGQNEQPAPPATSGPESAPLPPIELGGLFRQWLIAPTWPIKAKSLAFQRGIAESGGIAASGNPPDTRHSLRILHRESYEHIKAKRHIVNTAGDGADDVPLARQRQ